MGKIKRQRHTATAIPISPTQMMVVLFGGLWKYIEDGRHKTQQLLIADTAVLRFGKLSVVSA